MIQSRVADFFRTDPEETVCNKNPPPTVKQVSYYQENRLKQHLNSQDFGFQYFIIYIPNFFLSKIIPPYFIQGRQTVGEKISSFISNTLHTYIHWVPVGYA